MSREIKDLEKMSAAEVRKIKMVVFDVDGVIIPKGSALKKLAKKLGLKREEIITTGNALNDKEMLEFGIGVTVEPGTVLGRYKTSGNGLGGEELAEFLVKRLGR